MRVRITCQGHVCYMCNEVRSEIVTFTVTPVLERSRPGIVPCEVVESDES